MGLAELFVVCFRASLFSVGGMAALPLLRQDLVGGGLLSDDDVIAALTIGRMSTGPSGLYIVAMGYLAMGLPGAIVALLAAIIPPMLVVPAAAIVRPRLMQPRVAGAVRGVAVAAAGLVVATSLQLLVAATRPGGEVLSLGLAAVGVVVSVHGRRNPIPFIVAGGLLGIAWYVLVVGLPVGA